MKHYDYIFAGAGLASLMTAYRMATSGRFAGKKILLLDPDTKQANDRTWCFWQDGRGDWDSIVFRSWQTALFAGNGFSKKLDFGAYQYKMIRGSDFYTFVFKELSRHPYIEFVNQKVTGFTDRHINVEVNTEEENYTCGKLFNSIYNPEVSLAQTRYPVLQQHFIGWHIKTTHPAFDAQTPVFMDFGIPQKGNTRFMYVLPFSDNEAIVEYTLFSQNLLPEAEYGQAIQEYLSGRGISGYQIVARERGSIPMTSYPFWERNTLNVMNIGSAGGWTKASTGYTFRNSNKLSQKLSGSLSEYYDFRAFYTRSKFWYYDLLLLDILAKSNHLGSKIFSALFKKGNAGVVFKFLDEETSLPEDLKVISCCPKALFLKALWGRVVNL